MATKSYNSAPEDRQITAVWRLIALISSNAEEELRREDQPVKEELPTPAGGQRPSDGEGEEGAGLMINLGPCWLVLFSAGQLQLPSS